MTDLSDRLKEIAPDLAGFAKDLGDTKILLTLMAELLTNDDLSEETIDRFRNFDRFDNNGTLLRSCFRGKQLNF